jgi:AraC-like DNA-binding protein
MGGDPKKTAQKLGVSERTVYRAIAQDKEDKLQLSIFDELLKIEQHGQAV